MSEASKYERPSVDITLYAEEEISTASSGEPTGGGIQLPDDDW